MKHQQYKCPHVRHLAPSRLSASGATADSSHALSAVRLRALAAVRADEREAWASASAAVRADEREACTLLIDALASDQSSWPRPKLSQTSVSSVIEQGAAAIRARKDKGKRG